MKRMFTMKKIHVLSGLMISVFVTLHLFNHLCSVWGAGFHMEVMRTLRMVYRNDFAETILLLAIAAQIYSGLCLFRTKRRTAKTFFEILQTYSGLYLAVFFVIHLSAVFAGRLYFNLDTGFYFGVAGINTFPVNLFFIPYYALAVFSCFAHAAAIHRKKMKRSVFSLTPETQAKAVLLLGACVTIFMFYGLTNQFKGVEIPEKYHMIPRK
jgi:hypothetical protein